MIEEVMAQEGSLLKRYEIPYVDLVFGKELGAGSFGTVYKAVLRGDIDVAVKTMRVSKITKEELNKPVAPSLFRLFTGAVLHLL